MTRSRLLVSLLSSFMAVCTVVSVASAQTEGGLPPPASSPPPAPAASHGRGRGFGVGGVGYLSGLGGLSVVYDPGIWHLDAMIGMFGDGAGGADTAFNMGARFWYHLKTVGAADFSIGGGMAYQSFNNVGPGDATSALFIEGGGLIRVFIVDNVALGASTGVWIGAVDASGYAIGPTNLVGTASLHYFF
jgi:hypothetical protein